LFGGYWGYRAAPLKERQIQTLVLIKRREIEARKNAEVEAELEASKQEAGRMRR